MATRIPKPHKVHTAKQKLWLKKYQADNGFAEDAIPGRQTVAGLIRDIEAYELAAELADQAARLAADTIAELRTDIGELNLNISTRDANGEKPAGRSISPLWLGVPFALAILLFAICKSWVF